MISSGVRLGILHYEKYEREWMATVEIPPTKVRHSKRRRSRSRRICDAVLDMLFLDIVDSQMYLILALCGR